MRETLWATTGAVGALWLTLGAAALAAGAEGGNTSSGNVSTRTTSSTSSNTSTQTTTYSGAIPWADEVYAGRVQGRAARLAVRPSQGLPVRQRRVSMPVQMGRRTLGRRRCPRPPGAVHCRREPRRLRRSRKQGCVTRRVLMPPPRPFGVSWLFDRVERSLR